MPSPTTLSLRYRSLSGTHAPSEEHNRARALASNLLSHNLMHTNVRLAEELISSKLGAELVSLDSYASFQLASDYAPDMRHLPAPYGFKGGAARELIAALIHQRERRQPRDLDIIRRGSFIVAGDDDIAQRFMPQDYKHGARVEVISSMQRYFCSRDLTINEVAVFGNTASFSLLGGLDTIGHVLRPCRYRGGSIHKRPALEGRVVLKLARLFAEGQWHGDPVQLVGIPDTIAFSDVDLALHLDKAFQRSAAIAQIFVDTLIVLGAVPASTDPVARLLEELDYLRHGENGLLSHAPIG